MEGDRAAAAANNNSNEEGLRKELRSALQNISRRELKRPLEATYDHLLTGGIITHRKPVIPKDKFYKKVGSRLRDRVEKFMELTQGKDPFDRILQRQPLDEKNMRAAFTLREAKEHEQQSLLEATLAGLPRRNGKDEMVRRKELEVIAKSLQAKEPKLNQNSNNVSGNKRQRGRDSRSRSPTPPNHRGGVKNKGPQTEEARQRAEYDTLRAQTRARDEARARAREEDRKRREEELRSLKKPVNTTPKQALHNKYIIPIFKKLWDMEFDNLHGTNPFRIVIDRENCASMGAPDYFDVISIPMNLTYVQRKVQNVEYESFNQFKADIELIISNAILYNSDPSNPYRIAAEEMERRYQKMIAKLQKTLQQKKEQQKQKKQQQQQQKQQHN